eukprot:1652709-Heterocapsa_arctica.AAC.1
MVHGGPSRSGLQVPCSLVPASRGAGFTWASCHTRVRDDILPASRHRARGSDRPTCDIGSGAARSPGFDSPVRPGTGWDPRR